MTEYSRHQRTAKNRWKTTLTSGHIGYCPIWKKQNMKYSSLHLWCYFNTATFAECYFNTTVFEGWYFYYMKPDVQCGSGRSILNSSQNNNVFKSHRPSYTLTSQTEGRPRSEVKWLNNGVGKQNTAAGVHFTGAFVGNTAKILFYLKLRVYQIRLLV